MLKNYAGRKCPFCVTAISENQETVVCATCKIPHHKDCWSYNLDKCATFGCKGKLILEESYQFDLSKSVPEEIILPSNPVNSQGQTIEIQARTKKKATKPLNSKVIPKKQYNKIYFNNKVVPEPEFVVPQYVYEDLITPEPIKRKRELLKKKFQPIEIEKADFQNVPKPAPFIPDYVHVDMREKTPPRPRLRIRSARDYNLDKEEIVTFESPPKPDPFIPDYVNEEMPVILRKRKKRKYKITNIQIINLPAPQTDYIPVVEPEYFIPDYVNAEEFATVESIFTEDILKEKKCVHCSKIIKADELSCPFCKKSLTNKENVSTLRKISINSININPDSKYQPYAILYANSSDIKSIDFSVDGTNIAFGSRDKNIRIFNIESKECISTLRGHTNSVNSVSYSACGKFLASAGLDRTIKVWDVNTGECIKTITGNPMGFNYIVYSSDGGYILTCSGEGMVKIWNIQTSECLRLFKVDLNWINCAAFSLDGIMVASGDTEGNVRLWNIATNENTRILKPHFDSVNSMLFSYDRKYFLSAGSDRTIKVTDLDEWQVRKTFSGHQDIINSIVLSPDGRYVASSSRDSSVKIWEIESSKCVRTISNHSGSVNSVAYSPNGRFIASGGDEKVIKVWNLY